MLEAKIGEASILKKLLDATRELVTDSGFECTEEGINVQALDKSRVVLVSINLDRKLFINYRCDKPMFLGINLSGLAGALTCARDDDVCTLKARDDAGLVNLIYEAKNTDHIAEYEMKRTDIDADQLGIPDTEYDAVVTMPVAEFARIVRALSQLGESVRIEVNKEGARFVSEGGAAHGSLLLEHSSGKMGKEDEEDGEGSEGKARVKKEKDDEDGASKKREKKATENEEQGVFIGLHQHVSQTFSLKYLVNFTQSSSLSHRVSLMMGNSVPLLVSYEFEHGYIRYFLAPKIGDD